MTLPSSGAIRLGQVNTELGLGATATIKLGNSAVRTLAGRPSGSVAMSNLRGKSNGVQALGSFNMTSAISNSSSGTTVGFSSGSFGAISPTTLFGMGVSSCGITRLVNEAGAVSYFIGMQLNSGGNATSRSVRKIRIGGLTINCYITQNTDLKGANTVNTASLSNTTSPQFFSSVPITLEQYNYIYNNIANKTTLVEFLP